MPPALAAWGTGFLATAWPGRVVTMAAIAVTSAAVTVCAFLCAPAMQSLTSRRRLGTGRVGRGTSRAGHPAWEASVCAAGLVLAAAAVVLASTAARLHARESGLLPVWVAQRAVATLTGRVAGDPLPTRGVPGRPPRWAVRLVLDAASARGRATSASGTVLAIGDPGLAALVPGSRVSLVGRLAPTEAGDPAVAVVSVLGDVAVVHPPALAWRLAAGARAGLRRACAGLPGAAPGLVPGLVVGDTSGLAAQTLDEMRAAGLTHVTAVSGANLAIATTAVLAVTTGLPRRARVLLALLSTAAFVVLTGPEPSVLRAAAMAGVGLLAMAAGRPARALPALAATVVLLVCLDPWLSRSFGFALSCLATGALVLLAPVWARGLRRVVPAPLAVAVAAPAAAQVACAPVLVLLQPTVSLVAVPANLLAGPAVAPATLFGLVAAGLAPLSGWAAHVAAWPAGVAAWWIAEVARVAAGVPGAALAWPPGLAGAGLMTISSAAFVALTVRRRRPVEGGPPGWPRRGRPGLVPRSRLVAAALALALLGSAGGCAAAVGWPVPDPVSWAHAGRAWPDPRWLVVACDVGQGDALVLRSGLDRGVLIDAGPDPGRVDRCLRRLHVRHLDLVVLTHDHADHVLGLPGALHGRDVGRLLVSPLPEPRQNALAVDAWAGDARVRVEQAWAGAAGVAAAQGWSLSWQVLEPAEAPRPPDPGEGGDGTAVNESSVVVLARVRAPDGEGLSVLALGDLEIAGQEGLARRITSGAADLGGGVDVVKVAHHGSAKQVAALYALTGARVGLVSVGSGNDYGHPAPSALAMLAGLGVAAVRTDLDGSIALVAHGDTALVDVSGR